MIEPLNLEGLSFGKGGQYKILSSLGIGGEGQVFGLENGKGEIKAVKMIPFDHSETVCTTWTIKQLDLRSKYLIGRTRMAESQWVERTSEKVRKCLVDTLKDLKRQQDVHRRISSVSHRMLIPTVEECGVFLVSTDRGQNRPGAFPVVYTIMPLIIGQTLSQRLSQIDQYQRIQPFVYHKPGRTPLPEVSSYKRLAEQCIESLLRGVSNLFKAGFQLGLDIHLNNIMHGHLLGEERDDFFMVDVRPYESSNRQEFKRAVASIMSVGNEIMVWDLISAWHDDIQKDRFYLDQELSKMNKKLKRELSSSFLKRMKDIVQAACKTAWP
jgi:hypothetical protein